MTKESDNNIQVEEEIYPKFRTDTIKVKQIYTREVSELESTKNQLDNSIFLVETNYD
jgi:hypothetical protein